MAERTQTVVPPKMRNLFKSVYCIVACAKIEFINKSKSDKPKGSRIKMLGVNCASPLGWLKKRGIWGGKLTQNIATAKIEIATEINPQKNGFLIEISFGMIFGRIFT